MQWRKLSSGMLSQSSISLSFIHFIVVVIVVVVVVVVVAAVVVATTVDVHAHQIQWLYLATIQTM
jgi:hypothetical protein